jgi:TPR repeat protein
MRTLTAVFLLAFVVARPCTARGDAPQPAFGDLGLRTEVKGALHIIRSVIQGSPADLVGLRAGDVITHIDGEATRPLKLEEAAGRLRGQTGTRVKLTIVREGLADPFDLTLARARIPADAAAGKPPAPSTAAAPPAEATGPTMKLVEVRDASGQPVPEEQLKEAQAKLLEERAKEKDEQARALAQIQQTRKKAEAGDADAQVEMGDFYSGAQATSLKSLRDDAEAFRWYRRAADQKNAFAEYVVGDAYLNGTGVSKDVGAAIPWFRRSADQGNFQAQTGLGWCYENGLGVGKDLGQARRWYQLAANQGWWQAKNALARVGGASGSTREPSNGAATTASFASLPDTGKKSGNCNPGFARGLKGPLTVNLHFNFEYNPKGDRAIWMEKGVERLKRMIAARAEANPGGPRFTWVDRSPSDLIVQFYMTGRSNTPGRPYTAYWANMDTMAERQSGYMFRISTQARDAQEKAWGNEVIEEAVNKWYGFIADGWTCN